MDKDTEIMLDPNKIKRRFRRTMNRLHRINSGDTSFSEIMEDMIESFTKHTPITDINPGSVFTTMIEMAAKEQAQIDVMIGELLNKKI
jgi:transcription termination factor NusB